MESCQSRATPSETTHDPEAAKPYDDARHSSPSSFSQAWKTVPWFGLHGLSSVFMTILNKRVMLLFPYPFLLIAIQNLVGVSFAVIAAKRFNAIPMNEWKSWHLVQCLPMTIAFTIMLWSSLQSLHLLSVPLVVVCRNLTPLLTALGESFIIGSVHFPTATYFALLLSLTGSVIYATNDSSVSFAGLQYALLNVLFVAACSLLEKRTSRLLSDKQTPSGLNSYRCILSVPLLLLCHTASHITAGEEGGFIGHVEGLDSSQKYSLLLLIGTTSVFGFTIGFANFQLQKLVAATSIAVANICYKLITSILGLLIFPTVVSLMGWVGYFLSFSGFMLYVRIRQNNSKLTPLPTTSTSRNPSSPH